MDVGRRVDDPERFVINSENLPPSPSPLPSFVRSLPLFNVSNNVTSFCLGSLSFTSYNVVFFRNKNKLEYCHEFLWVMFSSPFAFTPGCSRVVVFSSFLPPLFCCGRYPLFSNRWCLVSISLFSPAASGLDSSCPISCPCVRCFAFLLIIVSSCLVFPFVSRNVTSRWLPGSDLPHLYCPFLYSLSRSSFSDLLLVWRWFSSFAVCWLWF